LTWKLLYRLPLNLMIGTAKHILYRLLATVALAAFAFGCYSLANAQSPGDYTYELGLVYTNNSGGTVTGLMPVEVDALLLVNGGFIDADGEDSLFTDQAEAEIQGFTQSMGSDNINWWSFIDVADGATENNIVFSGGPVHTDGFPVHTQNRDEGTSDTGDISFVRVADAASLDILDDIDINITASALTCGILAEKSSRSLTVSWLDEDSWGIYFVGETDSFASAINNNGTGTTSSLAYSVTPVVDIDLCGYFTPDGATGVSDFRIIDITSGADILIARFRFGGTPARRFPVSPAVPDLTNTDHTILFPFPVPLTGGREYLIACDCGASNRGFGDFDVTSASGIRYRGVNIGKQSVSWTQPEFNSTTNERPGILFVDRTAVDGQVIAVVDNIQLDSIAGWDGSEATWRYTYLDPNHVFLKDAVIQDVSAVSVGSIEVNALDILIGSGLDGGINQVTIIGGVTTFLDLDFTGDDMSETQEGNGGNGFIWLGDIVDDSASSNDGEYHIIADTTGLNISVGPIMSQPTPTPIPTPGAVDLVSPGPIDPFFTPVPTVDSPLFAQPLRDTAATTGVTEVWWLLLIVPILAILTARTFVYSKSFLLAAVVAGFGFSIISLIAGAQFGMWLAVLFMLFLTGIVTIQFSRTG